jgi:hypothetical protein
VVLSESVVTTNAYGGDVDERWYYCLDHETVEPYAGCRAEVRIGPFPTREEAEQALDTVARRNEAWDNDPDWSDD